MSNNGFFDYLHYTWIFDETQAEQQSEDETPPQSQSGSGGGEYPSDAF